MKLVSLENLSKYNELLNQKTVRSVNSVKPDSNGNVTLEIPQAIGVSRFPDYENPITVYDVANKGIKKNINFDYTFTEDGYLHYRLISDSRQDYTAIFGGFLIVNNSGVNLYECSRSPVVSEVHECINNIIPVQKGSTIHIDWLQCCADSYNCIEFFPLKNRNLVLSSESSESHQSTDSINEISIDTHHRYNKILLNTSETTLKFIGNQNSENNSNIVLKLDLFLEQGTGTNTVTWPENIKWENGVKPVLALDKGNTDYICLISLDSGKTFYGYSKAVWLK